MDNGKFIMSQKINDRKIALFMLPLLTCGAGAEKYFINLAKNFNDRGIRADVITMDEAFYRKFIRALHIFVCGNFFGKIDSLRETERSVIDQMGGAKWIKVSRRNLKKTLNSYDIIYSKNELVDLFLLKIIGYKKLPPVIVGVHTPILYPSTKTFLSKLHNFLYMGAVYRALLKGVKCVHLSNKFTKDLVDNAFNVKTELIYYPFSVSDIKERSLNNKYPDIFDSKKLNIAFVARLGEQKGVDDLAEIITKLSLEVGLIKNIKMNIFGSGDKEKEDMIRDLAVRYSFVEYFGHIENKYIPNILSKSDLFISTAKWETLPFNVLEAQAMGLPVIAFDIPGPRDIIVNNVTGYLVKNNEEFLDKILEFKRDSFKKENISKNIENKFEPSIIYEKILKMFKDCMFQDKK
ncbi:MAG: glycosyltransferase family 4 protein [Candidatus Moraniibacteriota bacterium]